MQWTYSDTCVLKLRRLTVRVAISGFAFGSDLDLFTTVIQVGTIGCGFVTVSLTQKDRPGVEEQCAHTIISTSLPILDLYPAAADTHGRRLDKCSGPTRVNMWSSQIRKLLALLLALLLSLLIAAVSCHGF